MELIDYKKTKLVAIWLFVCSFSIFVMAVIGAVTRLTGSGLSMVEWRPLIGALPPMNDAEWIRVFDLYKASPQFVEVNFDMELAEFKKIFFWEWFHRLWGRAIGIIYTVPFLFFLCAKRLPKVYLPSFFGFLILGAGQGFLGWYMVKSGLVDVPEVSHYRLAAHLGLAILLYGLLLHMALKLYIEPSRDRACLAPMYKPVRNVFIVLLPTLLWGAFVAGLDAGMVYNSFPMMGKYPWPSEIFEIQPIWLNFFENHATVQFCHRVLALVTGVYILSVFFKSTRFKKSRRVTLAFNYLSVLVLLQIVLGIITLLTAVNIYIAVLHQACALLLLGSLIWVFHEVPPTKYSMDE